MLVSTDWDAAALARVVSERMTERGVKQNAIAKRAGIATATLRAIQLGYEKHRPTPDTLARLATALGFAPGYLKDVSEGLQQPAAVDVSSERQQPGSGNVEPEFTQDVLAGRLTKLDTIEKSLDNVVTAVRNIDRKLDQIVVDIQYFRPQDP